MSENILGPKDVDLSTPPQGERFYPLSDFPLKEMPFRSRATWGYASGRNIKFINFADHRALQASELNELQEHHVSAQSLQFRFNANWKNSSFGVIPSWTGIMPIDPTNVVVYEPEIIDSSNVKLRFFMSRGWYLTRRKSNDKLNRWLFLPDDFSIEFTYTNSDLVYERYVGFQWHSHVVKCCDQGDCANTDPDIPVWKEIFSKEFRDNSQIYTSDTQNENTCGANRGVMHMIANDETFIQSANTDQTTIGLSSVNEGLDAVLSLFKLVRNGSQYEVRYANDLTLIGDIDIGLPENKIFTTDGTNLGNFSIAYGTWNAATNGLSPAQGGTSSSLNEGGSISLSNGTITLSTKEVGVPAAVSGALGSNNSRAEIRLDGNYTSPFFSRKTILGYEKWDARVRARVKLVDPLETHLCIVGMFRTHAADTLGYLLGESDGHGYFMGPDGNGSFERIVGFVNSLTDLTPTWKIVVMDGCIGNGRGFMDPLFSSYNEFDTGILCTTEHLLEVYMNKEETFAEFKIDGLRIKTFSEPNGLLCKQPRPKNAQNTIQRSVNIGCAVRDVAPTDFDDPMVGSRKAVKMVINELTVDVNSIVPFESLSYPQSWNLG